MGFFGNSLVAFGIAAVGGAVFAALGMPLPWALGAMTAAAIASIFFNHWPMPRPARNFARPVVGVLAGSAFAPEFFTQLAGWGVEVLSLLVYTLGITFIGFLFIRRAIKTNDATAFFSGATGGLGELVLMAERYGGEARTIALVHTFRIFLVVFIVPFILVAEQTGVSLARNPLSLRDGLLLLGAGLGGYLLGRYGRFPGGELVAAMVLSASLQISGLTEAAPPALLVILAQILIGAVTGSRFGGTTMRDFRQIGVVGAFWAIILVASAAAVAWLAASFSSFGFAALFLALAPGGTAEMIVIAISLGIDVSFISLCQVLRIVIILTMAPALFAVIRKYGAR